MVKQVPLIPVIKNSREELIQQVEDIHKVKEEYSTFEEYRIKLEDARELLMKLIHLKNYRTNLNTGKHVKHYANY